MSNRKRDSRIIERIVRESGIPDLLGVLSERINPTDLQSLLLEVYRRRMRTVTPAAVLKQYRENRFVRPANVSSRDSAEFDRLAFSLLPQGFEVIELSPVSPLGSCSVLATVDQNNVVTTCRNTEVCADPTNVLALECAARRKFGKAGFQINVKDPEGREWFLIDGGFTNWTEKLMSDRKEKLLISGMGTERFLLCFGSARKRGS